MRKSQIILILLAGVALSGSVGMAQQPSGARTGAGLVGATKASITINPDEAYKANCSRCHLPTRKFPERKTATIVQHMRVRANLTQAEAEAILGYLNR